MRAARPVAGGASRGADGRSAEERGAAVVDFVFVLVLLVPIVTGILQLALVLHVRNTLASAAAEGARHAALAGASPQDGVARTRAQWRGVVSDDFVREVRVEDVELRGAPGRRVVVDVRVPTLGLGGPAVEFTVTGSAVRELPRGAGG